MAIAYFALVIAAHEWILTVPSRSELGSKTSALQVEAADVSPIGFAPLKLAAAWRLGAADGRFAGISGLVLDRGQLLAISDLGVVASLPIPGRGSAQVTVKDLPAGPGSPRFKSDRDAEAIAADPAGRGWWVAFENRDELWLYDRAFSRPLSRVRLAAGEFSQNSGVEGLAAGPGALFLFPESGGEVVRVGQAPESIPIARPRRLAEAVRLKDGSFLVLQRRVTPFGFDNRLARLAGDGSLRELWRLPLPVRWFDNLEGMAVQPAGQGGYRLYVMSDSGLRPKAGTLLLVIDVPEALTKAA